MPRPEFDSNLSCDEFLSWYWLKNELLAFCRKAALPSTGSKPELTLRIAAHLSGQSVSSVPKVRRKGEMPSVFTLEMPIGQGWRCSTSLGAFLRSQCGNGFQFNAAVRNFIHTQAGRPLAEVVECYRASVAPDAPKASIASQFEYNQHTRDFYAQNPGVSRQQVLQSWKTRRSRRAD